MPLKLYSMIGLLALALATPLLAAADEVVVYSARKEHLIKPLFDRYSAQTGAEIRFITDKAGPLLQRLKAEGARTPADLLITVDVGNLWHAANSGVLARLKSPVLEANVPADLRDQDGRWFGLSQRARTVVHSTERVATSELDSYEDLADPKWKGRLCLRTSKKVYNQSLVASLIARLGEEQAEQVVRGWVKNLAVAPFANDNKAMEAVAAGQCDATVVNTYYFGRLLRERPDSQLAIYWPNQDSSGVHINLSGAGVTRHAKHPEAARKLLEWLSSEDAQADFAGINMEYPVNPKVAPSPLVASWGQFKADTLNVAQAGQRQADAIRLMDRAGYR